MNELIYKQEAIEAMCLACGHDCDKSKFVYNAPQDEQVIMCPEHYALSTLPSAESVKAYTKADYIMALHKEYGCTLTMAEEAHNKALEHLRSKARMKG